MNVGNSANLEPKNKLGTESCENISKSGASSSLTMHVPGQSNPPSE